MAIRTATIDLPGVYRIEEASNKAIRKLYQSHNRRKIALTVADEGIIYQPGDMVNITSTDRGVSLQIWVESVVMVGYGRYRITGRDYSTNHFTDDYIEAFDNSGGLSGGTTDAGDNEFFGTAAISDIPPACDAVETIAASVDFSHYPLFDPNYASTIPKYFRTSGGDIRSTDFRHGTASYVDDSQVWSNTAGSIRKDAIAGDRDVCGISGTLYGMYIDNFTSGAVWEGYTAAGGPSVSNIIWACAFRSLASGSEPISSTSDNITRSLASGTPPTRSTQARQIDTSFQGTTSRVFRVSGFEDITDPGNLNHDFAIPSELTPTGSNVQMVTCNVQFGSIYHVLEAATGRHRYGIRQTYSIKITIGGQTIGTQSGVVDMGDTYGSFGYTGD